MPTFEYLDVDQAIKKLENMKRKGKKAVVCVIDFDNDTAERKLVTYDESCRLIEKANTIIHNDDEFIPHIELYSTIQNDLKNILPLGIMHDLYISGVK